MARPVRIRTPLAPRRSPRVSGSASMNKTAPPPGAFLPHLAPALMLQAGVLILTGMILDGGGIFQICADAFVGFWGAALVLRLRCRGPISKTDAWLLRYGYLPACVISFLITLWIWQLRGYGQYL
jgi:hypothetical protein